MLNYWHIPAGCDQLFQYIELVKRLSIRSIEIPNGISHEGNVGLISSTRRRQEEHGSNNRQNACVAKTGRADVDVVVANAQTETNGDSRNDLAQDAPRHARLNDDDHAKPNPPQSIGGYRRPSKPLTRRNHAPDVRKVKDSGESRHEDDSKQIKRNHHCLGCISK